MKTMLLTACLLATASVGFAQLDSDTLTITSSRTLTSISDEVNVNVYVTAEANSTLDSILATLQPTGLTAANFVNVYSFGASTEWTFTLTGPYSKLKDMLAPVMSFPHRSDVQVGYSVYRAPMRPQSADACAWSALVNDAQAEAQRLAAAAGVRVGPILALSDERAATGAIIPLDIARFYAVPVFSGNFSLVTGLVGIRSASFLTGATTPPCSLTVQFKLLR